MSDQFQDIRFGSETMTAAEVRNLLNAKQDRLTVDGTQLVLNGSRLSITNTPTREEFATAVNAKQDKLVAGDNIRIDGVKISAVLPDAINTKDFVKMSDLDEKVDPLLEIINGKQTALTADNAGDHVTITRDKNTGKVTISADGVTQVSGMVVVRTVYNQSTHQLYNVMGKLVFKDGGITIEEQAQTQEITTAVQETVAT